MSDLSSSPVVSVLMPTYNRSNLLRLAIESVLAQTFSDFELIVVDNCSTDDTAVVVANFADSRIRFYQNDRNVGAVNNYNRALRLAHGRYLHLFSDDDVMRPENLARKVAVLNEFPQVGLVHSDIETINNDGQVTFGHWASINKEWQVLTQQSLMPKEVAFQMLYHEWNFISMPAVMVRKSVLDDNLLEFNNQLRYLIDLDLWLKCALFCDFYFINDVLISYRHHVKNESGMLNMNIHTLFLELFISKLSLLTLFGRQHTTSENEIGRIFKSTFRQLKWMKPDNKLTRPAKKMIKSLLTKFNI